MSRLFFLVKQLLLLTELDKFTNTGQISGLKRNNDPQGANLPPTMHYIFTSGVFFLCTTVIFAD
jgi:hypothetical protein